MPISVQKQDVTLDFQALLDSANISESFDTLNEAIAFISGNLNNCQYASDKFSNVFKPIAGFEIDEDAFKTSIDGMLEMINNFPTVNAEKNELMRKYETIQNKYDVLNEQYKEMCRECEDCTKSDNMRITELTAKIKDLEDNYDQKSALISEIETDIDVLVKEISDIIGDGSQFNENNNSISNLRKAVEQLIVINSNLQKEKERVSDMQTRIESQKQQITELAEKYNSLYASSGANEQTLQSMQQVYRTFLDHLNRIVIHNPQLRDEHIALLKKLPRDEIPFADISSILKEREELVNGWNNQQLKNIIETQTLIERINKERDEILMAVKQEPANLTDVISKFKTNLGDIFLQALQLHEKNLAVSLHSSLNITPADALAQNMQALSEILSTVLSQNKLSKQQILEQKTRIEQELENAKGELSIKNEQIDILEYQLNDQETNLVALRNQIVSLQNTLSESIKTSEDTSAQELILQNQLSDLKKNNDELQIKLNSLLNNGMKYLQDVIQEKTTAMRDDVDQVILNMVKIIVSNNRELKSLLANNFKIQPSTINTMINEAIKQYQNLTSTIVANEQTIKTLNANMNAIQEELNKLRAFETRAQTLAQQAEQLRDKIKASTSQERDSKENYEKLQKNYDFQKQKIHAALRKSFSDLGFFFEPSQNLYEDVETYLEYAGKLVPEDKYNTVAQQYAQEVAITSSLEKEIATLKQTIASLQNEITSLKEKQRLFAEESEKRYNAISRSFNTQTSAVAETQNQLTRLETENTRHKQKINELEITINTLRATTKTYAEALTAANEDKTNVSDELKRYQTSVNEYVKREQELRQTIERLENRILAFEQEKNNVAIETKRINDELNRVDKLYNDTVAAANATVIELNKAKQDAADAKTQLTTVQNKNTILNDRVAQLEQQLAEQTSDANKVSTKLKGQLSLLERQLAESEKKERERFPDMRPLWDPNISLSEKLVLLANASIQLTGNHELLPPAIKEFLIMSSDAQRAIVHRINNNQFTLLVDTAAKLLHYMSGKRQNVEYFVNAFETALFHGYVDKFANTFQKQIANMRTSIQKYTDISSFTTTRIQNDLDRLVKLATSIPAKFADRNPTPVIAIFNNMATIFQEMITNICGSATAKGRCKVSFEAEIVKISNLLLRLVSSTEFFLIPDSGSSSLQLFIDSLTVFKQSLNNPPPQPLSAAEQAEPSKYYIIYLREALALSNEINRIKTVLETRNLDSNFTILYERLVTMLKSIFFATKKNKELFPVMGLRDMATLSTARKEIAQLFQIIRHSSQTDPVRIHLEKLDAILHSMGSPKRQHETITRSIAQEFIIGLFHAISLLIQVDKDISNGELHEMFIQLQQSSTLSNILNCNRVSARIKNLPPNKTFNGKIFVPRQQPLTFENTIVALTRLIEITLHKLSIEEHHANKQVPPVNVFDVLLHSWGKKHLT